MAETPTPADMANQVAIACVNVQEMLAPIEESSRGYRKAMVDLGWSERSAEIMAVEYFKACMRMMGEVCV